MDFVTSQPWSFGFFCFIAGYVACSWVHRRAINRPLEPDPRVSEADIEDAARRGERIEAIRLYRRRHGAGLKEAVAAVDAITTRSNG